MIGAIIVGVAFVAGYFLGASRSAPSADWARLELRDADRYTKLSRSQIRND